MQDRIDQFCKLAEEHNEGRPRSGYRYPPELRREAVELAQEAATYGMSQQALIRGLGITTTTLNRWMEQGVPLFREVSVVDKPSLERDVVSSGGRLTLVTPSGYRIEGLAFPQVRRLLEMVT